MAENRQMIIDLGRRECLLINKATRAASAGRPCLPVADFLDLTGLSHIEAIRWPCLSQPAAEAVAPCKNDCRALGDIWRAGGAVWMSTFRLFHDGRKYAEKRARHLIRCEILGCCRDPSPHDRRGSAERVLYLTRKGLDVVAGEVGLQRAIVRGGGGPPPAHAARHSLGVAHFVLMVRCACKATRGEFDCGFQVDAAITKGNAEESESLRSGSLFGSCVPDAVLTITRNGKQIVYLLEWDCAEESCTTADSRLLQKTLQNKFLFYRELMEQEHVRQVFPDGFCLLVVTHGRRRMENLLRLADATGVAGISLFSEASRINFETILGPIWADPSQPGALDSLIGANNYARLKDLISRKR